MTFLSNPANGNQSAGNTTTANVPGSTTLNGAITDSVTTITLTSTTQFPSGGGSAKIESEYITYTGISGSDLTGVTRGAFDSTAVAHDSGVAISGIYIGTSDQSAQPDVGVSLKSDVSGTLYFDFSNDDTNWDSFPVTGFAIVADVHEFHTAVKLPRYFRTRFESSSNNASTSFRVYTYFGVFRQGNLPLNQNISDDSDSSIVRAIRTGANPNGTYVNEKADGFVFSNTTVLGGDEVFSSGILDLEGYSQIQTELFADQNGTLVGTWYADSGGNTAVRTFTFPYNATQSDLETFSTIAFTRYLEYTYTNGSSAQTNFYIALKLLTNALSGQILGLESFISNNMIANLGRNVIVAETESGNFQNIKSTDNNELRVKSTDQDAFGINLVTNYRPIVQSYQLYGVVTNPQLYETFTGSGGTIQASDDGTSSNLSITSTVGSFVTIRSKRVLKYRPGYSLNVKFAAKFDTSNAVANSLQFAGIGNSQSDLYFGYNGANFGLRYSTGGQLEIRRYQVTSAATTTHTGNITLNNTSYNVPLTNAGGATSFTAYQIATGNTFGGLWNTEFVGSNVYFIGASVGARTGTYAFSSTSAAATISRTKAGTALTTTEVAKESWNGWSPLISTLDPSKMNMYEIDYSWYGAGNIIYRIFNPDTSRYEVVHTLKFANSATVPSISAPNMYIQRGVASLGSTTPMRVFTTGMFGAILGEINRTIGPASAVSAEKTIALNTETVIFVITNRKQINGFANQSEIFLDTLSISADGNKAVTFRIYKNPTTISAGSTSDYLNYSYINETNSLVLVDTTADTFSGGSLIFSTTIAKSSSSSIILRERNLFLDRNDRIIITARSTSGSDVSAALTLLEDY